jgi:hypothetical protein
VIELASLAAILLLTALAWAMGFRTDPTLDDAGARAEAEGRLAGFRAGDVALAQGGRGAIVRGLDGSLALLLPLADGWIARRLPRNLVHCHAGQLIARLGEPMLAEARLSLPACPAWLERAA